MLFSYEYKKLMCLNLPVFVFLFQFSSKGPSVEFLSIGRCSVMKRAAVTAATPAAQQAMSNRQMMQKLILKAKG